MASDQQSKIVTWLEQIMVGFGAGWVMYLMLGLSVISLGIILERAWFFHSLKDDLAQLAADLRKALDVSFDAARKRLEQSPSAEAAVVMAGLELADKGADSVETAMEGAAALQRMKLERRLAYLATLGNNAPFIGLFGTVIGVIGAFKALDADAAKGATEAAGQMANKQVMGAIAEALVATAVGIAVAIPAVAANNTYQRMIKSTLANTEALSKVLLAHLRAVPRAEASVRPVEKSAEKSAEKPAEKSGKGGKKSEGGKKPKDDDAKSGEGAES
ncbi:MAG: MotA/TolQ/ExbB proton channel family protein [Deltaproteobacteria bacterium]|nr:MotA/TolQ/ExbB proton channel family protein [Deltaproteobacteria bacterium]